MATLEAVDHHGRGKASVGHTEQVGAPAAAVAAADTGPSSSLQPSSLDFRAVTMPGPAPPRPTPPPAGDTDASPPFRLLLRPSTFCFRDQLPRLGDPRLTSRRT